MRRRLQYLTERLDTLRAIVDACSDCDPYGLLLYGAPMTHCPKHPNFKQPDIAAIWRERNTLRNELAA
jgi:hypothetical protein